MTIRIGEIDVEVERVEALEIRKDDVIVITIPDDSSDDDAKALHNLFAQMFAGRKVVVLRAGVALRVMRPE